MDGFPCQQTTPSSLPVILALSLSDLGLDELNAHVLEHLKRRGKVEVEVRSLAECWPSLKPEARSSGGISIIDTIGHAVTAHASFELCATQRMAPSLRKPFRL